MSRRRKAQRGRSPPRKRAAPAAARVEVPATEELVREGHDPLHAAYIAAQHLISGWLERAARAKGTTVAKHARVVAAAEEEYTPSGPPMSPLTTSFFSCWSCLDLRFKGRTVARRLLEAANPPAALATHRAAVEAFEASRMGVYEPLGAAGGLVWLRELLTEREVLCHCPTGYPGQAGELWYARVLPPLDGVEAEHPVVFTTPYVIAWPGKQEWLRYLERTLPETETTSERDAALHELLKHGPDAYYWPEFVFRAYANHRSDAILLAGIPDDPSSLPHGDEPPPRLPSV